MLCLERSENKTLGIGAIIRKLACFDESKAGLVVGVTDDLTRVFDAVELARAGAEALGGKGGGGRPEFAQAGGPDGAKAETALAAIVDRIGAAQAGEPALSSGSA